MVMKTAGYFDLCITWHLNDGKEKSVHEIFVFNLCTKIFAFHLNSVFICRRLCDNSVRIRSNAAARRITRRHYWLLLRFVPNKIHFRFVGLRRCCRGYDRLLNIIRMTNQNVNQCFLFVLLLNGNDWCRRCRRYWRFYKNDFVMSLGWLKFHWSSIKRKKISCGRKFICIYANKYLGF